MLEDDLFKRYEYGVSGGIGISYTLKEKVSFSFELRTNQGMSDIKDKFDDPNSKFLKLNTVNFLFGVTQHFNPKTKTSIM